jgi:plasmid stabilization system protein ParE
MPPSAVELHPQAIEDIRFARDWYSARNTEAADAFFRELEAAVAAIAEGPERWPPYIHHTRRYLLRRFPFSVVYRETASSIQIVAIAHSKRRPGFWQAR